MKAVRRSDTPLELALRSALHRRGLRFRVHVRPVKELRRIADVVFTKARVAIFVDGCFWHGCPDHGVLPVANGDWWKKKIDLNKSRDAETTSALRAAGWEVVRIWGHEELEKYLDQIETLVRCRG